MRIHLNYEYSLIEAISLISVGLRIRPYDITAIQYEDGSGRKFHIKINAGEWQYVSLPSKIDLQPGLLIAAED